MKKSMLNMLLILALAFTVGACTKMTTDETDTEGELATGVTEDVAAPAPAPADFVVKACSEMGLNFPDGWNVSSDKVKGQITAAAEEIVLTPAEKDEEIEFDESVQVTFVYVPAMGQAPEVPAIEPKENENGSWNVSICSIEDCRVEGRPDVEQVKVCMIGTLATNQMPVSIATWQGE